MKINEGVDFMTLVQNKTSLIRRFSILAVALLLASFVSLGAAPSASAKTLDAPTGAPVNVPAAILYVGCDALLNGNTVSVDWYYIRLDGTVGSRTATIDNGGLTSNTGAPTVQFYNVSINYQSTNALYEFNLANGNYVDVYIYPSNWGRDARNGNIWATVQC
ncbi:MAG: hypothetical protein BGO39_11515 [Chloroflexi bacterium 54-19]|nr:MAG: hypothetical protein BGO39_11515 [Chloroflexi bacterium 54-19]